MYAWPPALRLGEWEELGAWDESRAAVRDVRVGRLGTGGTDDIMVFSWAELTLGLMG